MKKMCFVVMFVCALVIPSLAGAVTINYGNQTLSTDFTASHFNDVWNLMGGDLTLSYRIDLTGIQASALQGWSNWTEVGLREVGAGDFNPGPFNTYQGGAGGWMVSHVDSVTSNNALLNDNDSNGLQASGGRDQNDYDALVPNAVVTPFGTTNNYGMWFDRDGMDQWQVTYWGSIDKGTYNTGGIYDIVISYHAINAGLGTMFATVNGVPTGFYTAGWKNAPPEIYPAGLSFKGDMAQMQVFAGLASNYEGGSVALSNITVTGTQVPEPATMLLLGLGLVGLAGVRRKFKK